MQGPTSEAGLPPPRVLVAEDRELNYELVKDVLEAAGWEVSWAQDGPQALKQLLSVSYDLLLLDLHMPGLSGDQVLASFREQSQGPAPHVIVVTADVLAAIGDQLVELGVDGVMTKPIDLAALTKVANAVSGSRTRDAS
ncbi:MAG TPA: response regulator [Candidatus Dormibacteraeota bacterium]